jgi:hypothetical protein
MFGCISSDSKRRAKGNSFPRFVEEDREYDKNVYLSVTLGHIT